MMKKNITDLMLDRKYDDAKFLIKAFLLRDISPQDMCWAFVNLAICNTELDLLGLAYKNLCDVDKLLQEIWSYPRIKYDKLGKAKPQPPLNLVHWYYFTTALHLMKQGDYNMSRYWLSAIDLKLVDSSLSGSVKQLLDHMETSSYNTNIANLEKSICS